MGFLFLLSDKKVAIIKFEYYTCIHKYKKDVTSIQSMNQQYKKNLLKIWGFDLSEFSYSVQSSVYV